MNRYLPAMWVALMLVVTSKANAIDHIDVKGFHLGMTQPEMMLHANSYCYNYCGSVYATTPFTVGGVRGSWNNATYDANGLADSVSFIFPSSHFEELKAAFIEKYPDTVCAATEVITGIGVRVPAVRCVYWTESESIMLAQYANSIDESQIWMKSAELMKQSSEKAEALKKDF
jgi:hypothetical protein